MPAHRVFAARSRSAGRDHCGTPSKRESIRTTDEIEQDNRQRERMAVIREFVESKTRRPATVGRN